MGNLNPDAAPDVGIADLRRQLKELRQEIAFLRSSQDVVGNSTISGGRRLVVADGGGIRLEAADGTVIFEMLSSTGNPEPDGDPQPMVLMRRADGTVALSLEDPLPNLDGYRQILRLWDRSGNEIFAEDATGGEGLARPYLTTPLFPARYTDWQATTSATFETVWHGYISKHNPRIWLDVRHTSDEPATSGTLRVLADGSVLGGSKSVGFVISQHIVDEVLPGTYAASVYVEIQARRDAGTGNIRCAPAMNLGRRSL